MAKSHERISMLPSKAVCDLAENSDCLSVAHARFLDVASAERELSETIVQPPGGFENAGSFRTAKRPYQKGVIVSVGDIVVGEDLADADGGGSLHNQYLLFSRPASNVAYEPYRVLRITQPGTSKMEFDLNPPEVF